MRPLTSPDDERWINAVERAQIGKYVAAWDAWHAWDVTIADRARISGKPLAWFARVGRRMLRAALAEQRKVQRLARLLGFGARDLDACSPALRRYVSRGFGA
jgi:hypothetical protein